MPDVELIWDADCPNVTAARDLVRRALSSAGLPPTWTEWEIGAPETPARVAGFGSPTVLVDGEDVTGAAAADSSDCCRIYPDAAGGFRGVPSLDEIVRALTVAAPRRRAHA